MSSLSECDKPATEPLWRAADGSPGAGQPIWHSQWSRGSSTPRVAAESWGPACPLSRHPPVGACPSWTLLVPWPLLGAVKMFAVIRARHQGESRGGERKVILTTPISIRVRLLKLARPGVGWWTEINGDRRLLGRCVSNSSHWVLS